MISGNGADLQCILPCNGSKKCGCLANWDITPMSDMNEVMSIDSQVYCLMHLLLIQVSIEKNKKCSPQYKNEPMRFSFKLSCLQPNATCSLTCCFELHGVDQIERYSQDQ